MEITSINLKKVYEKIGIVPWFLNALLAFSIVFLGGLSIYLLKHKGLIIYYLDLKKKTTQLEDEQIMYEHRYNIAKDITFFLLNYTPENFLYKHMFINKFYVAPRWKSKFIKKANDSFAIVQQNNISCYFLLKTMEIYKEGVYVKGTIYLYNEKVTIKREGGVYIMFTPSSQNYGLMITDYIIDWGKRES